MKDFVFEWQVHEDVNRITPKWIAKIAIWSVIVAYLPNIIWYIMGYPLDATLMHCLVMTIGMPIIVVFSMRTYQKHVSHVTLHNSVHINANMGLVTKEEIASPFHHYIEEWKASRQDFQEISLDDNVFLIYATWHVDVFTKKHGGRQGVLVSSEIQERQLRIDISPGRANELDKFLKMHYNSIRTSIKQ